jgi:hypothetical protein
MGSLSDSRGWAMLANAFGGKDSPKAQPIEFLPYPDELSKSNSKLSDHTAQILRRLYKRGLAPPVFWSAIVNVLEELEL